MSKRLDTIERKTNRIKQALSTIQQILLQEVLPALCTLDNTLNPMNLFVALLPQWVTQEDEDVPFYNIATESPLSIDNTTVHSNKYAPPSELNKAAIWAHKIQATAKTVREAKIWGQEDKKQLQVKKRKLIQRK